MLQWSRAHPSGGWAAAPASAVEIAARQATAQQSPGGLEGLRMEQPEVPELGQSLRRLSVTSCEGAAERAAAGSRRWCGRWCGAVASVGTAVLLPSCHCPAELSPAAEQPGS